MQTSKAISKPFMGASVEEGVSKDHPSLFDQLLFYTSDKSLEVPLRIP